VYKDANSSGNVHKGGKLEYSGLPLHVDWQPSKKGEDRDNATAPFFVVVGKTLNSDHTPGANKTFGTTDPDNPFHLNGNGCKGEVASVAAAQAYFQRPAISDNDPTAKGLPSEIYKKGVYPSLYSPYWQARLANVPLTATVASAILCVN